MRSRAFLLAAVMGLGLVSGIGSVQATTTGAAAAQDVALTPAPDKARFVSDPTADDGAALLLHSRSTAEGWKDATAPIATLVVRARGHQCEGAPVLRVKVDGQVILTASVDAEDWTDYTSTTAIPPGAARVEVAFTNDLYRSACDRNLLVDTVTFSAAAEVAPVPDSALLFDADVARNGLSAYAHVIHGERISVVDDPVLGDARKVMRFTVQDGDIGPTENPRAQVETPKMLRGGDEFWVGWSTLFPPDWPNRLPSGGASWITLSELYGPPYAGAAPVKFGMRSGTDALTWQRNSNYGWDIPWERGPVQTNRWYDQVLHVKLSSDPEVGFVELYVNTGGGWQQQTLRGSARLHMRTMDSSNGGGPNYHKLALYRKRGMYPVLTVFHAEHRVGTSFDAVAPNSYPSAPGP